MARSPLAVLLVCLLGTSAPAAARGPGSACTLPLLGADRLGPASELARQGDVLYAIAGAGLLSIDLSDPLHPVALSRLDLDFEPLELSVSGDVLAAAAGVRGLVLFDVSAPAHPVRAAELDTPGFAHGVFATPGRVYLADRRLGSGTGARGVLIVDVSDPAAPVEIGAHGFGLWGATDVVVRGTTAFALEYLGRLHLLEVSDPAAIVVLGSGEAEGDEIRVNGSGQRGFTYGSSTGHHTFSWVQLIDLSNPAAPRVESTLLSDAEDGTLYSSFAIGDGRLYLGDAFEAFWIWDVSDLRHPVLLSQLPRTAASSDLLRLGDLLFAAAGDDGLQVLDVSRPHDPRLVGALRTPARSLGVAIRGSSAGVRTANALRFFDLSDPTRIRSAGGIPGLLVDRWLVPPAELAWEGDLVAVPGAGGVALIDAANPSEPVPLASFPSPTPVLAAALRAPYAYLGVETAYPSDDSVRVLDLADPTQPVEVGTWGMLNFVAERMHLEGDLLIAGGRSSNPRLLDLHLPDFPRDLGFLGTGGLDAIAAEGTLVYTATGSVLRIHDIDPSDPVLLSSTDLGHNGIVDLSLAHRRAAVTLRSGVVQVLDLRDPAHPVVAGEAELFGDGSAVAFGHGRLVVADGRFGVAVYADCPFFADGFESGDTSAWSAVQP